MASILIVDDDVEFRALLRAYLESDGHEVYEAVDGKEAALLYRVHLPDMVITDIFMPEQDGLELIMELKVRFPVVKVIAMSGGSRGLAARPSLRMTRLLGAVQQLEKPFTKEQVLAAVHALL
ncbi:MAG: response regulator [Magnetococcus sp. YQC-3]